MQKSVGVSLVALAMGSGCKDIQRFSTAAGESYCGRIVPSHFVRRGFQDSVCMRMTFDGNHLTDTPGALWTDDGLLIAAPMRPLPELAHDPLLTFDFGEGRDKNLLFAVDPTATDGGTAAMAVLSLMHTGEAEVRLIRGAPGGNRGAFTDASFGPALFGVFAPLRRELGLCAAQPGCAWRTE